MQPGMDRSMEQKEVKSGPPDRLRLNLNPLLQDVIGQTSTSDWFLISFAPLCNRLFPTIHPLPSIPGSAGVSQPDRL